MPIRLFFPYLKLIFFFLIGYFRQTLYIVYYFFNNLSYSHFFLLQSFLFFSFGLRK
jgi:hypothetical protein